MVGLTCNKKDAISKIALIYLSKKEKEVRKTLNCINLYIFIFLNRILVTDLYLIAPLPKS